MIYVDRHACGRDDWGVARRVEEGPRGSDIADEV